MIYPPTLKRVVAAAATLACFCGFAPEQTADVYFGLDNPTPQEWRRWYDALVRERSEVRKRAKIDPRIYDDPASSWSDVTYRQFHLFLYDEGFYDRARGRYRTGELLAEWTAHFGRVDSVLLWHAYPRLGFDERGQFDYYRDLPGGLERLRRDVSDVLHAHGARVLVDYNPWDVSGDLDNAAHRAEYRELAELVRALDVDGIMLDTLTEVPKALGEAIRRVKRGVVFSPERRPPDADLSYSRQSWAQWYDLGPAEHARPSIYRQSWLERRHRQFAIRRWDRSRAGDIVYSFFNASGMLVWDNIFGSWNPYDASDREWLAATGAFLDVYGGFLASAEFAPLVPTGVSGLDANQWTSTRAEEPRLVLLYRNRTDHELEAVVPTAPPPPGYGYFTFFMPTHAEREPGARFAVAPGGTQALVLDRAERAAKALRRVADRMRAASRPAPGYEEPAPEPKLVPRPAFAPGGDSDLVRLPGGDFTMTIAHAKRECGCYATGTDASALWGWYFEDVITHKIPTHLEPFAIKRTSVTNDEFLRFVAEARYVPRESGNFLRHVARGHDGSLPARLGGVAGALPVTYVSLDDARAYARWKGERIPTEAEWQWAAEGAGRGHRWPWGNDDARARDGRYVNRSGRLDSAGSHIHGATPQGVLGLTGNCWELTESEHSDGHTRFVVVRGGSYLPPAESGWVIPRGPRPNDFHAKYVLLGDALDRSAAVGFRTVADLR